MRNICKECGQRPVAINYYKEGRTFYRSKCDHCAGQRKEGIPLWAKAGYKKKAACDKCGFKARHHAQLAVYHVDGDLNNCTLRNLKTVCLNCIAEITWLDLPWRRGELEPDC